MSDINVISEDRAAEAGTTDRAGEVGPTHGAAEAGPTDDWAVTYSEISWDPC